MLSLSYWFKKTHSIYHLTFMDTSTKALLANAPTNVIRSSRSGILRANTARIKKIFINNNIVTL